jgi:N-6 DNA Methylase
LSSRITHSKLGEIQTAVADYWADKSSASRTPLSLWMADVTLRFAREALKRGNPQVKDSNLHTLWRILDQAAKINLPEMPPWFAYLEAALHMSERMLGAQLSEARRQRAHFSIETNRLRGQPCGAYATPHFIVETVLSDVFATVKSDRRLSMLDLSVEAGHFPVSVVAHAPQGCRISFYGLDRDPVALKLTHKMFSFATKQSQSAGKTLSLSCRDSLLDPLPTSWPTLFDVVVGNPPWAGTKNSYNRAIKGVFAPWLSHNFDLYLAFILRASQYVKPGGILAFVVPSTLLFNDSALHVREHILEHYDVLSMRLFPRRSFIEVPCLIPIAMVLTKKSGLPTTRTKTLIEYHPHKLGGRFRPRTSSRTFAPAYWRKDPMKCFHPLVGSQYSVYLKHFESLPRLSEVGLVLGAAKLETTNTVQLKTNFSGFHARDIRAFHACRRSCRIYKTNESCFACGPAAEHLGARKVVFQNFRYMTHEKRLVAAAIGPGDYGVSTAAQFIPYEEKFADFYAALLNSSVINSWFKLGDVSRSIKLALVRNIPVSLEEGLMLEIGRVAARARAALCALHDRLDLCPVSGRELLCHGPNHDVYLELHEGQRRMEHLFCELYGLSAKQRRLANSISDMRVF